MKAILAFAFLVIAAQATTPAYILGFTDQIGLNSEQMKHGSACFESLRKVAMDVRHLIQSKQNDASEVLRSAIELITDVEYKLKADCSVYINDISRVLFRNTHGDLKEVALRNWNEYSAEIIQQLAIYFDFVAAQNDYEAGRTEAYIYQILLGVETPRKLRVPEEMYDGHFVEVNVTKFIKENTRGYYKTLGIHDSRVVQDNIDCGLARYNAFYKIHDLTEVLRTSSSHTSEKVRAVEGLVHVFIQLHDACADAMAFNFNELIMPILSTFKAAPIHTSLAVIHNVARNLPEINFSSRLIQAFIYQGEYAEVGRVDAEQLLMILGNIYPH